MEEILIAWQTNTTKNLVNSYEINEIDDFYNCNMRQTFMDPNNPIVEEISVQVNSTQDFDQTIIDNAVHTLESTFYPRVIDHISANWISVVENTPENFINVDVFVQYLQMNHNAMHNNFHKCFILAAQFNGTRFEKEANRINFEIDRGNATITHWNYLD